MPHATDKIRTAQRVDGEYEVGALVVGEAHRVSGLVRDHVSDRFTHEVLWQIVVAVAQVVGGGRYL